MVAQLTGSRRVSLYEEIRTRADRLLPDIR